MTELKYGLSLKNKNEILSIVSRFVDLKTVPIYVFGSRAKNNFHPYADLDLCIRAESSSKLKQSLVLLKEALENSDLPFKVDLSLFEELPESFQQEVLTLDQRLDNL